MKALALSLCALACAVAVAGCGGKKGTVTLDIVTSAVDHPFADAAQVRFTIGGVAHTAAVSNGHFNFSSTQSPPKTSAPVYIDALDSAGNVLAHGQTPVLGLSAMNQGPYSVWVDTLGALSPAASKLDSPRTDVAAMNCTGLGAVFAGGRDTSGAALANVAIYDVFTQAIIQSEDGTLEPMSTARAAAAAVPDSPSGIVFGGAQAKNFGATGMALSSAELFDPSGNVWDAVPDSGTTDARSYATASVLSTGTGLITGGLDTNGNRLNTALTIPVGGSTTAIQPLAGVTMQAARAHHAAGGAMFPDGQGVLLVGGLPAGSMLPVLEEYSSDGTFKPFGSSGTTGGVENRSWAVAVGLTDGVLVLGGTIPSNAGFDVATDSSLYIATSGTPSVTRYESASGNALLSSARAHASLTLIGSQILVCGGIDGDNNAVASCDLINTTPMLSLDKTIPLGTARYDHVAVQLETGPVLLAGGLSSPGEPLGTIEIYTPETVLTPTTSSSTGSTSSTSSSLTELDDSITFTIRN